MWWCFLHDLLVSSTRPSDSLASDRLLGRSPLLTDTAGSKSIGEIRNHIPLRHEVLVPREQRFPHMPRDFRQFSHAQPLTVVDVLRLQDIVLPLDVRVKELDKVKVIR